MIDHDLHIVSPGAPLNEPLYGKKHAVVVGERLHLFALDATPTQIRRVVLDAPGAVADSRIVLNDARLIGAAPAGDGVVLLADRRDDGRLMLVGLADDGRIAWQRDLDIVRDAVEYPALVVADDGALRLSWLTSGDHPTLTITPLDGGAPGDPLRVPLPGTSYNLRVTALGDDLIVTRLADVNLTAHIMHIHSGQIIRQIAPETITTGALIHVVARAGALALLWQDHTNRTVQWAAYDRELTTTAPPQTLYTTGQDAKIRGVQPYISPAGVVLVQVIEAQHTGRSVQVPTTTQGGRYVPADDLMQRLFLTDGATITEPHGLPLNGSPYFAGGWLNGRLYLVHGEQHPLLTVCAVTAVD